MQYQTNIRSIHPSIMAGKGQGCKGQEEPGDKRRASINTKSNSTAMFFRLHYVEGPSGFFQNELYFYSLSIYLLFVSILYHIPVLIFRNPHFGI